MAILTVTETSRNGIADTLVAADPAGDEMPNNGNEFLMIRNGSAGAITVTFDIKTVVDGQAVTDRAVSIPAGATRLIGPFPTGVYNDANNRLDISYSATANLTLGAFKLGAL